jgi:hypothetical protein
MIDPHGHFADLQEAKIRPPTPSLPTTSVLCTLQKFNQDIISSRALRNLIDCHCIFKTPSMHTEAEKEKH